MPKSNRLSLTLSLLHLFIYFALGLYPDFFTIVFSLPSPVEINVDAAYIPPSFKLGKHFLGTDHLGRDVFSSVIYGCQTSLLVSFPAMVIAAAIGILLGLISGFYGNASKRMKWPEILSFLIAIPVAFFYGFYLLQFQLSEGFGQNFIEGVKVLTISLLIIIAIVLLLYFITRSISNVAKSYEIYAPIDEMILKLIELFSSIPRLILIISLSALVRPSLGVLILIIGLTSWTSMARLVRGEVLKVKGLQYIEAGKALGIRDEVLILRHILPNAIPATIVAFTFGLAGLLGLESTLSFLGIGLPPEYVSWGKVISLIRYNFSAWWLVVFPGIYLVLTVLSLHNISSFLLGKYSRPSS